ncbi:bifunctional phosphoribosyl-AMP cyclohydrolase/phosphoribosyl-ATP diphosphatase HisIE [soil metagenome]
MTDTPPGPGLVDELRYGADGLIPGIIQDARDGAVLMLGYLSRESVELTISTGTVHFHSRSRGRLWRKGETSGNELRLRRLRADCDADALLLEVDPLGPTCHTGSRTCFCPAPDPGPGLQDFAWLETLWSIIRARGEDRPEGSYTAGLLAGGVDAVGRKVVEEATEVLLAAKDDATAHAAAMSGPSVAATQEALAGEVADLLYHVLVLAAERGLAPSRVIAILRARHRAASEELPGSVPPGAA